MIPPPRQARSGHDRWLVSYADLVTLLFAFFTTLYAASAVKATSAEAPAPLTASAESAEPAAAAVTAAAAEAGDQPLDPLLSRLASRLEDDVRLERADVLRDGRGVVVSLPEDATFRVGSADVTPDARPLIARVAEELRAGPYALRIEGHTDDVPIRTSRYPSNWELSTARAGAVVAYLIRDLHFSPARLSAAGYAEFHPRVPNDSAGNRARNRRIDIVVLDLAAEGTVTEPTE
ncbi:MAG: OmpA family protein [Vicinamibacterales bacterium]